MKKIIIYNSKNDYWRPFIDFINEVNIKIKFLGDKIIAIDSGGNYVEVYSPPDNKLYKLLYNIDIKYFYSMGTYIGMMQPGKWFKPSLPLAHRLASFCNNPVKCSIVSEEGEKFFLYGRKVLEDNLITWNKGIVLVVNNIGEALGWGRGIIAKIGGERRRLLEPIWDLGWYLRRGG